MGKVQIIKKSRKENRCNKCRKTIPVGSMYYKGVINFGPTIVRCSDCKLQHWEVTTSEYNLDVGELVYNWREDYGISEDSVEEIQNRVDEILDSVQERYDNMPESLQYSSNGELLQERIDALESVSSELDCFDIDILKEDALNDVSTDIDENLSYDDILDSNGFSEELKQELISQLEYKIEEFIDDALGELGV